MPLAPLHLPTVSDDDDHRAVSRFDVERLACGELSGARKAEVEAAIASDPALKAFFDDVTASDAAFLALAPPAAFMAGLAPRLTQPASLWSRLTGMVSSLRFQAALGAAAACALVVVMVTGPGDGPVGVDGGTRTKGGHIEPAVGFFVKDADGARLGTPGEGLHAGDTIQLALTDADKRAMVIVGVDGAGAVSVYAAEETTTVPKGAGAPRVLPAAMVLDDTLGVERFFVVYGDSLEAIERDARTAAEALGAAVKAGRVDLSTVPRLDVDVDLPQASVFIRKVR